MKNICNVCGVDKASKIAKETFLDYTNCIKTCDIIINDNGICIKLKNGSFIQLTNCNNCNVKILKEFDYLISEGANDKPWDYAI